MKPLVWNSISFGSHTKLVSGIGVRGSRFVFIWGFAVLQPPQPGSEKACINLSEKMCQIRGEIEKFKDFDGALGSFPVWPPQLVSRSYASDWYDLFMDWYL